MVRETPKGGTRETCRFYAKGNCRFGAKCKNAHDIKFVTVSPIDAGESGGGTNEDLNGATKRQLELSPASPQATALPPVNAIQRTNKPCRLWKAGSCTWGERCRFQHEFNVTSPSVGDGRTILPDGEGNAEPLRASCVANNTQPPATNPVSSRLPNRRQQKGKGKATFPSPPSSATLDINQAYEEALHRVHEQANIARLARKKQEALRKEREGAARLLKDQEEAARKAREEAARLAQERAEAARRERQAQLEREREEARERERAVQRQRQQEKWVKELSVSTQKVVLNSFVKFELGLAIQHVICGFEASQVLIKNLPLDAKKSEIIELFTQQGINEEDVVLLKTDVVDGHQQATVLGKAMDVETVALGLDGIDFRGEDLEFVVCERSSDNRSMGTSSRNTYHLNVSWPPPFLTMIARFPQHDIYDISARARNLNGQLLNGQRVRVQLHEGQRTNYGYGYDSDDDYRPPDQSVKISKIPGRTSTAEVRNFAGTEHVEMSPETCSSNDILAALTTHIRRLPNSNLRTLTIENSVRPNSVSAKAVFDSWEDAKSAYDSLNGTIINPNFPPLRFYLPDPYRFTLTLDEKQYNAQATQWTELCGSGKDKETKIQTKTIDRAGGKKVMISLFGRDKKLVGALKVRIESMAAGQKLDAAHWHPSFKSARGQAFLDGLYGSTGAYVRSDWKHNCIAISGTTAAIEAAKTRLQEEVERISAEEWTIPLQRRALGFFIREGLATMKGLLGDENVTLDVRSAKIVLHGADLEEARHHLRQLMDAFADRNATPSTTSDDTLCPICYDSVSQPIEISCEHTYCSSCLRHYILSTLDNHNFPLKCMGDEARCNKPLSLPLIQKFLPPQRFEQLLEAAFISYIDKNPEVFKYCSTPDCSQIYRATPELQFLQCPSCFAEICTSCHDEGHNGMTCAERRVHKDPGEQERLLEAWAVDNNAKRCPSCRAFVEKTEGCNHMSCKCGVHFCWICMGVFDAGRIYDHMSQAHGGFYNDANPNPQRQPVAGAAARQTPDIVQIAGGPAAVAEQMAALRLIEQQRANRVQAAIRLAPPPAPAAPRPLNPLDAQADWLRTLRRQQELLAERRRHEAADAAMRQQRFREAEARQREERERQAREAMTREAEENKGWCVIM